MNTFYNIVLALGSLSMFVCAGSGFYSAGQLGDDDALSGTKNLLYAGASMAILAALILGGMSGVGFWRARSGQSTMSSYIDYGLFIFAGLMVLVSVILYAVAYSQLNTGTDASGTLYGDLYSASKTGTMTSLAAGVIGLGFMGLVFLFVGGTYLLARGKGVAHQPLLPTSIAVQQQAVGTPYTSFAGLPAPEQVYQAPAVQQVQQQVPQVSGQQYAARYGYGVPAQAQTRVLPSYEYGAGGMPTEYIKF